MRPRRVVLALVGVGGAVTVTVAAVPGLRFAYRAEPLHVAIETAAALIGLLVAFLVFGRAQRSGRQVDLVLLVALSVLALTNVFLAMLPAVLGAVGGRVVTWSAIGGHVVAAALLAWAAFSSAATPRRRRLWVGLALAGGVVAVDVGLTALVRGSLPAAAPSPLPPGRPQLSGHAAVLALQLVIAVLYALASVGFTRQAERRRDPFVAWLATGTALAAFSRVNYFLYPSLYSKWVYTGDFFRLAFYAALLVGALQEIATFWRAASEAAILEERRRIARDLHDGLAQEVAYITRASKLLRDGQPADDLPERLAAAAERAFRESRQVIAALAAPAGEPLEAVLGRVAHDTAGRFGVDVDLDLPAGVRLDPARTEVLVRIAGEAVANAARHSGADRVGVVLAWRGGRLWLQVRDDGSGFDPAEAPAAAGGFGLTSMRERAAAVGAEFRLLSRPGAGTRVEVSF